MSKYIDAEKLIAEIERRLQENADRALFYGAAFAGRAAEDNDLKNLVTSLQQEQPEVDLKKEAISFCFDNGINISPRQAGNIARHFYELGLNARKEESK